MEKQNKIKAKKKQAEIEELQRQVAVMRREIPPLFQQKLDTVFQERAAAMKQHVFDGRRIPEPKFFDKTALDKSSQANKAKFESIIRNTQDAAFMRSVIKDNERKLQKWKNNMEKVERIMNEMKK